MIRPVKQTGPECLLAVVAMLSGAPYGAVRDYAKELFGRLKDWSEYMDTISERAIKTQKLPTQEEEDEYIYSILILNEEFGAMDTDELESVLRTLHVFKANTFNQIMDVGFSLIIKNPYYMRDELNRLFTESTPKVPEGAGALITTPWHPMAQGSAHIMAYCGGCIIDPGDGMIYRKEDLKDRHLKRYEYIVPVKGGEKCLT